MDLHEDKADFADYIKCMVALDLYKNRKVSFGYCASMAEMSKENFAKFLGENGVSIFSYEDEGEFLEELGMRKVIVNSTPLIALSHIGQLYFCRFFGLLML